MNYENLDLETTTVRENDTLSLIIEGTNIRKTDNYSPSKFPEQWFAALYYSLPPTSSSSYTWRQLGDYYLSLIKNTLGESQVIDSIAALECFSDKTNIIDKCFKYVKNTIRYYASLEKEFSYIPRTPAKIIANGYGDCKEMVVILLLLFRKFDIDARLVLVNSAGNFQYLNEFPTLGTFDHMIVACKDTSGQMLYLDPTRKEYTSSSSYYHLIHQKVLLIKKDESDLGVVLPYELYTNEVRTTNKIILSPDKKL